MNATPEKISTEALRGRRVAGAVLLLVAGSALFGKTLPFAWRDGLLLLLGVGFIVGAALGRVAALLIPVLSFLLFRRRVRWPFFPAAALALWPDRDRPVPALHQAARKAVAAAGWKRRPGFPCGGH